MEKVSIIWGGRSHRQEDPEHNVAEHFEFQTQQEADAFVQGVDAASGYMEYAVVVLGKCEYEYTDLERAVGHTADARLGHCTLDAVGALGDYETQYCLGHLIVLQGENEESAV